MTHSWLASIFSVVAVCDDSGSCKSWTDCYGLGDCINHSCRCDAYATSPDCSEFAALPIESYEKAGYRNETAPSWGGSFMWDDAGYIHGFAGSMTPGFPDRYSSYGDAQVTHIRSRSLEGPWDVVGVADSGNLQAQIHKVPVSATGGYVVFSSLGVGLSGAWVAELEDFGKNGNPEFQTLFHFPDPVDSQRPWICHTNGWGAMILPDGSALAHFRSGGHHCEEDSYEGWPREKVGLLRADCWNCTYELITDEPLWVGQESGESNEDMFMFWTHRGIHMVLHSQDPRDVPEVPTQVRGAIAFSPDTRTFDPKSWVISPRPAFGPNISLRNGSTLEALRRQRPSLVFSAIDGMDSSTGWPKRTVTHLSTEVDLNYKPNDAGWGDSWTLVTPLVRGYASALI